MTPAGTPPAGTTTVALGVSASAREFSVALRGDDGSIRTSDPANSKGASDMAAVVAEMFEQSHTRPAQLREIRIDLGPGSYTGLRVAVTFARVTAHFQKVPVRTTTSLELMALAAWNSKAVSDDITIRPVLDARRNRFHHAAVRLQNTPVLIDDPRATELPELLESIRPGETLLTTAAVRTALSLGAGDRDIVFVEPIPWTAALLFDPRLAPRETGIDDLAPLYLMGSYAE